MTALRTRAAWKMALAIAENKANQAEERLTQARIDAEIDRFLNTTVKLDPAMHKYARPALAEHLTYDPATASIAITGRLKYGCITSTGQPDLRKLWTQLVDTDEGLRALTTPPNRYKAPQAPDASASPAQAYDGVNPYLPNEFGIQRHGAIFALEADNPALASQLKAQAQEMEALARC